MARHKKNMRTASMQETRQKLLDAAAEELAEQGFDGANVNHIAERAGYSIGTLYNYFPTKRELMYAFIAESAHLHVTYIQDRVLSSPLPTMRMETFFEAGFEFIEQYIIQAKAIFNTLNGPDEDFKLRLFQSYQPLFQLLSEEVIELGIQQGVFRQRDAKETANMIMLFYLGAGSQFNQEGKLWITAAQVSSFMLSALRDFNQE